MGLPASRAQQQGPSPSPPRTGLQTRTGRSPCPLISSDTAYRYPPVWTPSGRESDIRWPGSPTTRARNVVVTASCQRLLRDQRCRRLKERRYPTRRLWPSGVSRMDQRRTLDEVVGTYFRPCRWSGTEHRITVSASFDQPGHPTALNEFARRPPRRIPSFRLSSLTAEPNSTPRRVRLLTCPAGGSLTTTTRRLVLPNALRSTLSCVAQRTRRPRQESGRNM